MSHRTGRLAEEIKREVSSIIQMEMKDPRIGFVSITSVEVSGDARYANIFISVMGNEEQGKETLKALQRAQGYIRTELGKRIKIRYTPEIKFDLDDSISHGAKVMKLLREVKGEGEKPNNE